MKNIQSRTTPLLCALIESRTAHSRWARIASRTTHSLWALIASRTAHSLCALIASRPTHSLCAWVLALAAFPALAQNISIGVRGGIPFTDALHAVRSGNLGFDSDRPRYVIGPTFEVRLPLGLGFHVDALYRKISVAGTAEVVAPVTPQVFTGKNSFGFFQFPVMVKLRLGAGPFRPFISGGPSFSKLTGVGRAASCLISLGTGACAGRVLKTSGTGVAFGAGMDLKLPIIRLAPEIRYTRLGANFFEGSSVASLSSQRNQLDFLIGLTF